MGLDFGKVYKRRDGLQTKLIRFNNLGGVTSLTKENFEFLRLAGYQVLWKK